MTEQKSEKTKKDNYERTLSDKSDAKISEEFKYGDDEIYIPQAEYSAVCNADFLPMICNDFITDFLD